MTGKREIVIFGLKPPPYGGVAIFDELLSMGFEQNGVMHTSFTDVTLETLGEIKPDSVLLDSFYHSLEYPEGRKILKCLWVKSAKKLRWIKIIHNGSLIDRYKDYTPKQKFLFWMALKLFDEFIVVNDDLKDWLVNLIGVKKPVHMINSLLPIPDEYIPEDKILISHHERKTKIVTTVGVFIKEYGFADIVSAIESLMDEKGMEIKLVIVNGDWVTDPEYKEEILNGRDWIEVHRQLSHRETLGIMQNSDVFVRATYYESYGLSRVEASMCGIPVIATGLGETRGMMLFEPGDVKSLGKHLEKALSSNIQVDTRLTEIFRKEAKSNLRRIIEIAESAQP